MLPVARNVKSQLPKKKKRVANSIGFLLPTWTVDEINLPVWTVNQLYGMPNNATTGVGHLPSLVQEDLHVVFGAAATPAV